MIKSVLINHFRNTPRIKELELLALEEGFALPYPATRIVQLEATGAIVNLLTGEIEINAAETRIAVDAARAQRWLEVSA